MAPLPDEHRAARQQHDIGAQRGSAVDAVLRPGHLERELRREIEPSEVQDEHRAAPQLSPVAAHSS
jgi:hypothetical protein